MMHPFRTRFRNPASPDAGQSECGSSLGATAARSAHARPLRSLATVVLAGLVAVPAAGAGRPQPVSPGDPNEAVALPSPCPTFSWSAVPGAEAIELAVLDVDATLPTESAVAVLRERLPGGATSWTPTVERCLSPGRYAWAVRPIDADGAAAWSRLLYVTVPVAAGVDPSGATTRTTARSEGPSRVPGATEQEHGPAQGPSVQAEGVGRAPERGSGASVGIEGVNEDSVEGSAGVVGHALATTGETHGVLGVSASAAGSGVLGTTEASGALAAGVRGEAPAPGGSASGVVGETAASSAAGVLAVNLDPSGGPDLVLDGSVQGEVDALLSETGIDRPSSSPQTFDVGNSLGEMTLLVDGEPVVTAATDSDVLGDLSCSDGEVARFDGADWACAFVGAVCSPEPESCNGLDDDCDGTIDDPFLPGSGGQLGEPCTVGLGVCARTGHEVCADDGLGTECSVVPGPDSSETCNGLDDDCDGGVDEDFRAGGVGAYDLDTACGNCLTDCTAIFAGPNGSGVCDTGGGTPACALSCELGYFDLDGNPQNGCEAELDPQAIYVSATGVDAEDDEACGLGTPAFDPGEHPCATIGHGLDRAVEEGRSRVRVADGEYVEDVELRDGIDLLGAHDPTTWVRDTAATGTALRGVSGPGDRRAVIADDLADVLVEGFLIEGAPSTDLGGTSYAVWIKSGSATVELRGNRIRAGSGAPGTVGNRGDSGASAPDGGGRSDDSTAYDAFVATGSGACDAFNDRQLSNGAPFTCDFVPTDGGDGGGNQCPPSETLEEASAVDGSNAFGSGGVGGEAGDDSILSSGGSFCTVPTGDLVVGRDGADGNDGSNGVSGNGCGVGVGTVTGDFWVPFPSVSASRGGTGRGGGGGGAGGGASCLSCSESKDRLGGHGGGGGAGGCGGDGGEGGGGGGASIAVFVVGGTAPTIVDNEIVLGFGGPGGPGGAGGAPGAGGVGGEGGETGGLFCTGRGGRGGDGGDGGQGGGGGGGCGGPAYGFLTSGIGSPAYCASNTVAGGGGGAGGSGGPGVGSGGGDGDAGARQECRHL